MRIFKKSKFFTYILSELYSLYSHIFFWKKSGHKNENGGYENGKSIYAFKKAWCLFAYLYQILFLTINASPSLNSRLFHSCFSNFQFCHSFIFLYFWATVWYLLVALMHIFLNLAQTCTSGNLNTPLSKFGLLNPILLKDIWQNFVSVLSHVCP